MLFGLLHAYQDIAGVLFTAVAGLLFSLLAYGAGPLWPGVVMHALIDCAFSF